MYNRFNFLQNRSQAGRPENTSGGPRGPAGWGLAAKLLIAAALRGEAP